MISAVGTKRSSLHTLLRNRNKRFFIPGGVKLERRRKCMTKPDMVRTLNLNEEET